MKAYITEIEIYDDIETDKIVTLKRFDEAAFSVKVEDHILFPADLREIAALLESEVINKEIEIGEKR